MLSKIVAGTMVFFLGCAGAWASLDEQFNAADGTAPSGSVWNYTESKNAGTENLISEQNSGMLDFGATNMSGGYSKMALGSVASYDRGDPEDSLTVEMKYQYPSGMGRGYFSLWVSPQPITTGTPLNGIEFSVSGFGTTPGANTCAQWENNNRTWLYQGHQGSPGHMAPDTPHWIKLYVYYDEGQAQDRVGFYYSEDGQNWSLPTRPGVKASLQADTYYVSLTWSGKSDMGPSSMYNVDYITATPEPVSLCMLGLGAVLLGRRRRK